MTGQIPQFSPLGGGLDLVTPAISKKPGTVISAMNYEPTPQGYRRIGGFERYDGQPKPSEQQYWRQDFENGEVIIGDGAVIGSKIIGVTSGAEGIMVTAVVVLAGSIIAGTASGYVILRLVSGTFEDGEQLAVHQPFFFTSEFTNEYD